MDKGVLYLCATPIGNLDDITFRAVEVLKTVDLIACEDTRHTLKLLNRLEISKKLVSYHEHNKASKGVSLISDLLGGKSVALVTDAGTPAISDPGEDLVKLCIENNISVVPLPGAVAGINALIISGLSTRRFSFEGFLPISAGERTELISSLRESDHTLIFYEAPHRLKRTLEDLYNGLGNRKISIVKELTKIHESVIRTDLEASRTLFTDTEPRGEFVLVIEGRDVEKEKSAAFEEAGAIPISVHVDSLIAEGLTKKEAIKKAAEERGVPKREIYNEYEKNDGR